jgi:hypothetical protein
LMQCGLRDQGSKRIMCKVEHCGRWIDAIKPPSFVDFSEGLNLEAASRTQHENTAIVRHTLSEEDRDHSLKGGEAGHHARRPFGVASNCLRIRKCVHSRRYHVESAYRKIYAPSAPAGSVVGLPSGALTASANSGGRYSRSDQQRTACFVHCANDPLILDETTRTAGEEGVSQRVGESEDKESGL